MPNVKEVIQRKKAMFRGENIFTDSNIVWLTGILENEFEVDHKYLEFKFYKNRVIVLRESKENNDYVPIIIPEKFESQILGEAKGKKVEIGGQYRSHNEKDDDGISHLKIYVFVTYFKMYDTEDAVEEEANINAVYLEGYVCKEPVFRWTPSGQRITDLHLAVNRKYGKSAYIPCVAWEEDARYAAILKVGDFVKVYALSQSRYYYKELNPENGEGEWREAYEMSIIDIS